MKKLVSKTVFSKLPKAAKKAIVRTVKKMSSKRSKRSRSRY